MALAPAGEQLECGRGIVKARELPQSLGVPGKFRTERLAEGPQRRRPWSADKRRPPAGPRSHNARTDERCLARPGRSDHGQKSATSNSVPEHCDFMFAAEEIFRVVLGEGGKPRVWTLLLHFPESGRLTAPLEHSVKRLSQVIGRLESLLRFLFQTAPDNALRSGRDGKLLGGILQDRRQRRSDGLAPKWMFLRHELVQHHAEREDV